MAPGKWSLAYSLSSRTSISRNLSPRSSLAFTSSTVVSRMRFLASSTMCKKRGGCCCAIGASHLLSNAFYRNAPVGEGEGEDKDKDKDKEWNFRAQVQNRGWLRRFPRALQPRCSRGSSTTSAGWLVAMSVPSH